VIKVTRSNENCAKKHQILIFDVLIVMSAVSPYRLF